MATLGQIFRRLIFWQESSIQNLNLIFNFKKVNLFIFQLVIKSEKQQIECQNLK